jgi:dTDP-4-dehydrorhamnose reductase
MRVAVTGAGGRLGRALVSAMAASPALEAIPWSRPDYDLDDPTAAERLVDAERPDLVIHAAAWTDVDGCARDPFLAQRRNGDAAAEMSRACMAHGVNLVLISTNEVFDGARTDGVGYDRLDDPNPINPYGVSKLAGETAAWQAFAAEGAPKLAIVRTAWLFGPPGEDFPTKILAAAERADAAGEPLRVVADEIGSPTYAPDLAEALVALLEAGVPRGIHHVVNDGVASRAEWAGEVLRLAGRSTMIEPIAMADWPRASTPPAWAVLAPTPLRGGRTMRGWREALAAYLSPVSVPGAPR